MQGAFRSDLLEMISSTGSSGFASSGQDPFEVYRVRCLIQSFRQRVLNHKRWGGREKFDWLEALLGYFGRTGKMTMTLQEFIDIVQKGDATAKQGGGFRTKPEVFDHLLIAVSGGKKTNKEKMAAAAAMAAAPALAAVAAKAAAAAADSAPAAAPFLSMFAAAKLLTAAEPDSVGCRIGESLFRPPKLDVKPPSAGTVDLAEAEHLVVEETSAFKSSEDPASTWMTASELKTVFESTADCLFAGTDLKEHRVKEEKTLDALGMFSLICSGKFPHIKRKRCDDIRAEFQARCEELPEDVRKEVAECLKDDAPVISQSKLLRRKIDAKELPGFERWLPGLEFLERTRCYSSAAVNVHAAHMQRHNEIVHDQRCESFHG